MKEGGGTLRELIEVWVDDALCWNSDSIVERGRKSCGGKGYSSAYSLRRRGETELNASDSFRSCGANQSTVKRRDTGGGRGEGGGVRESVEVTM